ncbi:hypothetical protein RI367_006136 [Sorochytrium milnesiophthora]
MSTEPPSAHASDDAHEWQHAGYEEDGHGAAEEKEEERLVYGVLPESIVTTLSNSADWKSRSSGIEAFHRTIANLDDASELLPHLPGVLDLLSGLLSDSNFKISLTALYIVGDIVTKIGLSVKPHLATLLPMLINRFADNKIIIRQANFKVITHLMHIMTPKPIIAIALHYTSHENARLKEEVVNLVIVALLLFTRFDFEFPSLIADLLTTLRDSKPKLKYVAVEAFAVIAHRISSAKVLRLLKSYGVEDETLQMLQMRFQNPLLPMLNSDGLVEHIINNRSAAPSPRVFQPSSAFNSFPSSIGPSSVSSFSHIDSFASPTPPDARMINQAPASLLAFQSYNTAYPSRQQPIKSAPTPLTRPDRNEQQPDYGYDAAADTQQQLKPRVMSATRSAPRTKMPWDRAPPIPETIQESTSSADYSREFVSDSGRNSQLSYSRAEAQHAGAIDAIIQDYASVSVSPPPQQEQHQPAATSQRSPKISEIPVPKSTYEQQQQQKKALNEHARNIRVRKSKLQTVSPPPPVQATSTASPPPEEDIEEDILSTEQEAATSSPARAKPRPAAIDTSPERLRQQKAAAAATVDSAIGSTTEEAPRGRVNRPSSATSASPSKVTISATSSKSPQPAERDPLLTTATKKSAGVSPKKSAQPTARSPEKQRRGPPYRNTDLANADDLKGELGKLRNAAEWEQKATILEYLQGQCSASPGVIQSAFHETIMAVVQEITNLRSAVSKVAVTCLEHMFIAFGKSMDTDLDITLSTLLKKCGENSNFMVESVDSCLAQLAANASFTRALPTLLGYGDNKNANIRCKVSELLCHFITSLPEAQLQRYASSSVDMEKLMPVLVMFLRDGVLETKANAKRILAHLQRVPEWERIVNKTLTGTQAMDVKKALAAVGDLGSASPTKPRASAGPQSAVADTESGVSPVKRKVRSARTRNPALPSIDMEQLAATLQDLGSKDWKQRLDALGQLQASLERSPSAWASLESAPTVKIFDVFNERLHDGNSKVQVMALQVLQGMVSVMGKTLEPVLLSLTTTLCNNMSTSNVSVRSLSTERIDDLLGMAHGPDGSITCAALMVQSFAGYLNFGSSVRVKPVVLEKLIGLFDAFSTEANGEGQSAPPRLTTVLKHLLPFVTKTLSDTKDPSALVSRQSPPAAPPPGCTDVKLLNVYLIQTLHRCYGKALLDTLQGATAGANGGSGNGAVSTWLDKTSSAGNLGVMAAAGSPVTTGPSSSSFNFNVGVVTQDTFLALQSILR